MPRTIPQNKIDRIRELRRKGWSLSEIYREIKVGYGSVSRYIKGVKILPQYRQVWLSKRKGSVTRKLRQENEAYQKAKTLIGKLSKKEKLLFISALYWGEGGKIDLNFTNSDPEMISVFISGLKNVLGIKPNDIRVSIRIYEDLDRNLCLTHWSRIVGIPAKDFVSVNILEGRKSGKLQYGLCRVRIKKGGIVLKYLQAINKRVSEID